jgi:hypothetical protein
MCGMASPLRKCVTAKFSRCHIWVPIVTVAGSGAADVAMVMRLTSTVAARFIAAFPMRFLGQNLSVSFPKHPFHLPFCASKNATLSATTGRRVRNRVDSDSTRSSWLAPSSERSVIWPPAAFCLA